MSGNTKEIYEQMESDELCGEISDRDLVLEIFMFSWTPLLCSTEGI